MRKFLVTCNYWGKTEGKGKLEHISDFDIYLNHLEIEL